MTTSLFTAYLSVCSKLFQYHSCNLLLIYVTRLIAQRLEEEKVLAMTDVVLKAINSAN